MVEICPKCHKPKEPESEKQQRQQQQREKKDRKTEKVAKDGAGKKRVVGAEVVIDSEPKSTGANVNKTLTITGDDDDGYYDEDDDDDGECQNAKFFKSLSSSDFSDADKKKGGLFQSGKGGKSDKKNVRRGKKGLRKGRKKKIDRRIKIDSEIQKQGWNG